MARTVERWASCWRRSRRDGDTPGFPATQVLFVILAVSCLVLPACTHQIRWQQLCAEGERYLESGDYSQAEMLRSRGRHRAGKDAAQDCQLGSCLAALAKVGRLEGADELCLIKRQPELVEATRQNLLGLSQKMMDQTLDLR